MTAADDGFPWKEPTEVDRYRERLGEWIRAQIAHIGYIKRSHGAAGMAERLAGELQAWESCLGRLSMDDPNEEGETAESWEAMPDPYGPDGFDENGRDRRGLDRRGRDVWGFDHNGRDPSGRDWTGRVVAPPPSPTESSRATPREQNESPTPDQADGMDEEPPPRHSPLKHDDDCTCRICDPSGRISALADSYGRTWDALQNARCEVVALRRELARGLPPPTAQSSAYDWDRIVNSPWAPNGRPARTAPDIAPVTHPPAPPIIAAPIPPPPPKRTATPLKRFAKLEMDS